MELARRVGLNVTPVELTTAAGRLALLVERFDRAGSERRRLVSALTVLGLTSFPEGRYATYSALARQIRRIFANADSELRELFGGIAFNMLCGNTDDHGRNHSAFVGENLRLTPAYDICLQARSCTVSSQAMAYDDSGNRAARLVLLVDAAHLYHLDRAEAQDIVTLRETVIREQWNDACEQAQLTDVARAGFWERQFLNPHVFET